MDNKYIETIGEYLKDEDEQILIQICNNLNIENPKALQIEDIYYAIVEKIENDEEMLEYFRNIAKENKVYTKLFPYFKRLENIRVFIDNQIEYGLNIDDINKMEKSFKKRFNDKKKNEDKKRRLIDKYTKYAGILLFVFLIIPFTIYFWNPFFQTHITKQAIITDAIVLEDERTFSTASFITSIYWEYEYYVDGVKYTDNDETVSFGLGPTYDKTIKIYYQGNNPGESEVYDFNWFLALDALVVDILMLIGIILSFRDSKIHNWKNGWKRW